MNKLKITLNTQCDGVHPFAVDTIAPGEYVIENIETGRSGEVIIVLEHDVRFVIGHTNVVTPDGLVPLELNALGLALFGTQAHILERARQCAGIDDVRELLGLVGMRVQS